MKNFQVRTFANLYLFFILLGPITAIVYWLISKNAAFLPKLIYFPALLIMGLTIIKNRKIKIDWFILFILIYSVFLIFYGLITNPINKATFAHIQTLLLPILGFSFGHLLVSQKQHFFSYFESKIFNYGLILIFLIVLYYFLHLAGFIPYFGASTLISIPIIYAYHRKRYFLLSLFFLGSVFTGKRTVIIGIVVVFLLSLFWSKRKSPWLYLIISPILFIVLFLLYSNINDYDVLRRIAILLDGETSINTATSGRLDDVSGAINSINKSAWHWIFGKGIGAQFEVFSEWRPDDVWFTHYTHITPISYIFLGGAFLAIPIYTRLISLFVYALNHTHNFYCLLFMYYFIVSMSGAILFSDPFVWTIAGILLSQSRIKTNKYQEYST